MSQTKNFFRITDVTPEHARTLAPGIEAQIYQGANAMISVVRLAPGARGPLHSHPEEQWGIILEGSGIRTQGGEDVPVAAGDFWISPCDVPHGFLAGEKGAFVIDIFSPPRSDYRKDAAVRIRDADVA